MRRVRAKILLSDEERLQLQSISRKRSAALSLILRAKIILLAEEKQCNKAVAEQLQITVQQVGKWCHRWIDLKKDKKSITERLSDSKRSGKPTKIIPEQLCKLVALACDSPEVYGRPISHWTQPELADEAIKQHIFSSISARHIGRLLAQLALRPHKNQYWLHKKIDEFREQKITNICTLYREASALKKSRDRDR